MSKYSMFNWFNKKKEEPIVEAPVVVIEQPTPKKPKKPRVKKEKVVPPKVEPKVDILKFDFDPRDPRLGSIELDWNTEFVELLVYHGYVGNTEEDIVDKWLNDVCRNIVANQYPGTNTSMSLSGNNIVNKKDLGSGKTEVS
jgi:hypothetical protein